MVRVKYFFLGKREHQGDATGSLPYGYTLTVWHMAEKVTV